MSDLANRVELEELIIKQASENPRYRELLLADPKQLLEKQLGGQELPDGLEVNVVEEGANKIYIRLPHAVQEGEELSAEDLEQVAGGKGNQDKVYCNNAASAGGFASKNEISLQ